MILVLPVRQKLHSAHDGKSSLNRGDCDVWDIVMVVVCLGDKFSGI